MILKKEFSVFQHHMIVLPIGTLKFPIGIRREKRDLVRFDKINVKLPGFK